MDKLIVDTFNNGNIKVTLRSDRDTQEVESITLDLTKVDRASLDLASVVIAGFRDTAIRGED